MSFLLRCLGKVVMEVLRDGWSCTNRHHGLVRNDQLDLEKCFAYTKPSSSMLSA
jgi:hypothetical protein